MGCWAWSPSHSVGREGRGRVKLRPLRRRSRGERAPVKLGALCRRSRMERGTPMTMVKQILDTKGYAVWSIHPQESVFAAIQQMADKEVGALVVLEGDALVGIISERDYARKVILKGRASHETAVRDI